MYHLFRNHARPLVQMVSQQISAVMEQLPLHPSFFPYFANQFCTESSQWTTKEDASVPFTKAKVILTKLQDIVASC